MTDEELNTLRIDEQIAKMRADIITKRNSLDCTLTNWEQIVSLGNDLLEMADLILQAYPSITFDAEGMPRAADPV